MDRAKLLELLLSLFPGEQPETSHAYVTIRHSPEVAPRAYLHVIFDGLLANEIASLESSLGENIPTDFRAFLQHCNGAIFFLGALSLYGFRKNMSRDPGRRQPFDLVEMNTLERPSWLPINGLIIGSYNFDGSYICASIASAKIERRERGAGRILNIWPDLDSFLASEVARLNALFSGLGITEFDDAETTPAILM